MSQSDLVCRENRRRQLIRERRLNGIDSIDVVGAHLCVRFLTGIPEVFRLGKRTRSTSDPSMLAHIVIHGGARVTGLRAIAIDAEHGGSKYDEDCLGIALDKEGDLSGYTLCFVETKDGRPTNVP